MTRPCFGLPHHTAVTVMNCKHQLCSHQLRPAEMLESRHQTSLETKILVLVSISGVWSPSQFQEQNSGLRLGLGVWSWFRSQRFGLSLDLSPEDLFLVSVSRAWTQVFQFCQKSLASCHHYTGNITIRTYDNDLPSSVGTASRMLTLRFCSGSNFKSSLSLSLITSCIW